MITLSCSTYGHRFLSLEKALERIAGLGFRAVDIVGTRPHLLPDDYDEAGIARLAAYIRSLGLTVSAVHAFDGHPFWHFTAANARHREDTVRHVKKCIDVAQALDARIVAAITGMPVMIDVPEEEAWAYARDGLLDCAKHAEQAGVYLALEGEENNLVRTANDTMRMVRDVDHPHLQGLFEIGHANMMATDDPIQAVEILRGHLVYCHAHDNDGASDAHAVPGDGTVDWEGVIKALTAAEYEGYIAFELLVPNPDAGALRAKRFLEDVLAATPTRR